MLLMVQPHVAAGAALSEQAAVDCSARMRAMPRQSDAVEAGAIATLLESQVSKLRLLAWAGQCVCVFGNLKLHEAVLTDVIGVCCWCVCIGRLEEKEDVDLKKKKRPMGIHP